MNEDQILIVNQREDLKNLTKNTRKIIFTEGFTTIDFENLSGKNINEINLPSTLVEIHDYVFANNNITNINDNNTIIPPNI